MKENELKLIEWCWNNLQFHNCPDTWEDTYIVDILNGCTGFCHDYNGKAYKFSDIRFMFGI